LYYSIKSVKKKPFEFIKGLFKLYKYDENSLHINMSVAKKVKVAKAVKLKFEGILICIFSCCHFPIVITISFLYIESCFLKGFVNNFFAVFYYFYQCYFVSLIVVVYLIKNTQGH